MNELTLLELLVTGGIPVGGLIAAWVNMRVNVGSLNQKIDYLEEQLREEKKSNKDNFESISKDIKGIYTILTEIKVEIGRYEG